jgi:hypothetical protein
MMFARSATYATPARRLRRLGRTGAGARGFIMGYILFALLVLGIVTAVLSRINDAEADTKWVNDGVIRVRDNLQNIRVQVMTCSALLGVNEGSGDIVFPPQPDPKSPTPLPSLECPQGTLDPIRLFDGSAGVFPPDPPQGFTPYTYVNTYETAAPGAAAAVYVETSVGTLPGAAVLARIDRSAPGPDTVVTTDNGVTTLRYYLAQRQAAAAP